MKAKAVWQNDGLTFVGSANTGVEVRMASSLDEGKTGFRPMELMAVGLVGCTGMDVISILEKKRQDVTDFEVRVQTESAKDYPHVWTSVQIEYIVTGRNIDPEAVERAMQLSAERYCPAQNMINKAVDIDLSYTIHDLEKA